MQVALYKPHCEYGLKVQDIPAPLFNSSFLFLKSFNKLGIHCTIMPISPEVFYNSVDFLFGDICLIHIFLLFPDIGYIKFCSEML